MRRIRDDEPVPALAMALCNSARLGTVRRYLAINWSVGCATVTLLLAGFAWQSLEEDVGILYITLKC